MEYEICWDFAIGLKDEAYISGAVGSAPQLIELVAFKQMPNCDKSDHTDCPTPNIAETNCDIHT